MKNFCLNPWGRAGLVAASTLLLTACAPGQNNPTPAVSIDMSRYIAVGDSYTAGFSAGGLTLASQQYSYPNLVAQQLRFASPGIAFSQPELEAGTGSGYLELVDFSNIGFPRTRRVAGQSVQRTIINPAACNGADTLRVLARSSTSSTLPQNLGLPGFTLSQLDIANLGNATTAAPGTAFNPYLERLLPAGDGRTYRQVVTAAATSATFFTFFQGLDDLLPYVRSGGNCGGLEVTANRTLLQTTMRTNATAILNILTAGGRKGIIARLPDVSTLPLLRFGRGDKLQARLQAAAGDTARLYIEFPGLPVRTGAPQAITEEDYVLATALPRIGQLTPVVVGGTTLMLPYGRNIRNPLRDGDVLDKTELSYVTGIVSNYNIALDGLATDTYKFPIINASGKSTLDLQVSLFNQVADAISVGGVVYSSEPVRGNFFSLDNFSLTPRANGLLANTFIAAINKAYKANIPALDVNNLPTVAH